MILEGLFLMGAVWFAAYQINGLRRPVGGSVTTGSKSPELSKLEEYAGRLYEQRQYLAAEKAYLKVLKLNHKDALAYSRLGMIYVGLKNYDDAIECFQVSAQLRPSAASWFNLGLAYVENHNYIKAVASIEKAIMFEPSSARYLELAKTQLKMANSDKAIAALEKAVILEPKDKRALTLLAETYALAHYKDKAAETYARIARLDPSDRRAKRLATAA